MIAKAHLHSGYKQTMLRTRGWHLRGLGQAGGGGAGRTGGLITTTSSGPAGGAVARLTTLAQRAAQANAPQTKANTPVIVTRQPLPTIPATTTSPPPSPTKLTCPAGTVLDFYGENCIAAPIAATTNTGVNTVTAAVSIPTCPTGQTYDPNTGLCDICLPGETYNSSTGTCETSTNYLPWILGGVGVVLLFMLVSKK